MEMTKSIRFQVFDCFSFVLFVPASCSSCNRFQAETKPDN